MSGVRGSRERTPDIDLGSPGRCPKRPTLTVFDFDNSGSVCGIGGNDPIGRRFDEATLAVEAVGRRCRCRQELVAVTNFDTPNSGDVPPTPIRGGMAAIKQGLRIPGDGGGSSNLGPSLESVERLVALYPNHLPIVVVLSDFELFDPDVPGVLDRLAAFPGLVHAVVLRSDPPERLVEDPRVDVTHISHGDPPGSLARAVFGALTRTRIKRK